MNEFLLPDNHSNPLVGPSPEEQRHRFEEDARRGFQETQASLERQQILQEEFTQKYGQDLSDYGQAWAGRVLSTSGFVHLRSSMVQAKEVLPLFTKSLFEQAALQPEETRAEWLSGFLEDLDRIVPYSRPY